MPPGAKAGRRTRAAAHLRVGLRAVLLAAVAGFAVAVVLRGDDRDQVPLVDIGLYSGVYLVGAALLLLQPADDRHERWAWRALAAALVATTVGDTYYSTQLSQLPEPPFPSPADAIYLLYYPAAYTAVLLLIRRQVPRFYPSMVLDGLVAGLGASALVAAFVVASLVEATSGSLATVVVGLAYPVGDLMLVLVLVAGGAVLGTRITRPTGAVVVGLLLTATADMLYLLGVAGGTYTEGGPVDLVWLLAVVALAFAPVLHGPGSRTVAATRGGDGRLLGLPLLSATASLGVIALGQVTHVAPAALLLADACVLAACVRAWLTVREMRAGEQAKLSEAHRQARTDELTGLPNRRSLLESCDGFLATASGRHPVSVLLLDLDRFKEINDSLGHAGGDDLLWQVSRRLVQAMATLQTPGACVVARLGGDEFAVVLTDAGPERALAAGRVLRAALTAPFVVDGIRLHVDASVGVSTAPSPAATRGDLLRLADMAMYEAKRGHGGVVPSSDLTSVASPDRLRTVDELCGAIAHEEPGRTGVLVVHLQPQVRLGRHPEPPAGGEVVGVEALVRWDHPVRGLLLPAAFLPLVESAGLSLALAERVLDLSLTACRQWWDLGHEVPVSVNLSAADLDGPTMPALVMAALERHGLPPRALVVELTEETLMTDPLHSAAVLARIRGLGVAVSIDDYGTGYSSLAYLRDLSADELKLDRSFTADLLENSATASIVRSTVELAHSLGLRLVAEGIEDDASAGALAGFGCDVGQGFHIARPMPATDVLPWLEARQALTVARVTSC